MEHLIQLFLLAAKPQANIACPKLTVSYGSPWSAYAAAAAAAALNRTCHTHKAASG